LSLCSKSWRMAINRHALDRLLIPLPTCGKAAAESRSRRKRTLLSFQRPGRLDGVKKAPTRARGPRTSEFVFRMSL